MTIWVLLAVWLTPGGTPSHADTLRGVYASQAACEAALRSQSFGQPVVHTDQSTVVWRCSARDVRP